MRRDWGLFWSGCGIAFLGVLVAIPALLAYRDEYDPPCPEPEPPAMLIDGCAYRPGGFDWWIGRPGVVAFLVIAALLLLVALGVMRRGFRAR